MEDLNFSNVEYEVAGFFSREIRPLLWKLSLAELPKVYVTISMNEITSRCVNCPYILTHLFNVGREARNSL